MQEDAAFVQFGLTSANHQLAVFKRDGQIVVGKPGHGQGDTKAVRALMFDIIGRIAFGTLGGTLGQTFKLVESQQERMSGQTDLGHVPKPFASKRLSAGPQDGDPATLNMWVGSRLRKGGPLAH